MCGAWPKLGTGSLPHPTLKHGALRVAGLSTAPAPALHMPWPPSLGDSRSPLSRPVRSLGGGSNPHLCPLEVCGASEEAGPPGLQQCRPGTDLPLSPVTLCGDLLNLGYLHLTQR